ncbi:MAG: helix-turn-helix domain-containing protein [Candidatus Caldarchaeum sp.]
MEKLENRDATLSSSSPKPLMRKLRLMTHLFILLQLTTPASTASTFYTVSVEADGKGLWHVEHRYVLKTGEDLEAFKAAAASIAREIEAEYRSRVEDIIAKASNTLGRRMWLADFKVLTDVRQTLTGAVGVVALSFTWHGFASKKDETLLVGDVFIDGLSLVEGESFTVKIPDGYVVETVSPKPDEMQENLVRWYGRKSFSDGEPKLTLSPAAGLRKTDDILPGVLSALPLVATATVIAVMVIFIIMRRRQLVEGADIQMVLDVVRKHGGAVPQSLIVEETGMSKAKVSMILKLLEEQGRVSRVRRGREKLVRARG